MSEPTSPVVVAVAIAEELCEPLYRLGPWHLVSTAPDAAVLHDAAGRLEVTVTRRTP